MKKTNKMFGVVKNTTTFANNQQQMQKETENKIGWLSGRIPRSLQVCINEDGMAMGGLKDIAVVRLILTQHYISKGKLNPQVKP